MKTYGEWRYSSTILDHLHIWATLTPGERGRGTHWGGGWAGPEPVWTVWRKVYLLYFPGMEPQPSRPLPVATPTELSQSGVHVWTCLCTARGAEHSFVLVEAYRSKGLVRQFRAFLPGLGVSEHIVEVRFVEPLWTTPAEFWISDRLKDNVMLRPREQGLILTNLSREGCTRSTQYQLETWELSTFAWRRRKTKITRVETPGRRNLPILWLPVP
jgi:hypothetical protein